MNMETVEKIIDLAEKAESAKEFYDLLVEAGIHISKEKAADYFARVQNDERELTEEEIEIVCGGGTESTCGNHK